MLKKEKIRIFKEMYNENWKMPKKKITPIPKISYCVVIPFNNKEDYMEALTPIKNKWHADGMIIHNNLN